MWTRGDRNEYRRGRSDSLMPYPDIRNAHERNTEIPKKKSVDMKNYFVILYERGHYYAGTYKTNH